MNITPRLFSQIYCLSSLVFLAVVGMIGLTPQSWESLERASRMTGTNSLNAI